LLIAVLVLASSWRLIKEPFDVLMEAAPADLDVDGIGAAICAEQGVRSVHDLHVWTVTAGFGALAAHVVVSRDCDRDLVRRRLELTLTERFGIEHTTLQMEEEADRALLRVENAPHEG
jgi:cobalt-zinc-cadmium efflux system protein